MIGVNYLPRNELRGWRKSRFRLPNDGSAGKGAILLFGRDGTALEPCRPGNAILRIKWPIAIFATGKHNNIRYHPVRCFRKADVNRSTGKQFHHRFEVGIAIAPHRRAADPTRSRTTRPSTIVAASMSKGDDGSGTVAKEPPVPSAVSRSLRQTT